MYETNFLDSSIKFGPKLRWERIQKYYKKGFDFVAPLHLRVHGLGPFSKLDFVSSCGQGTDHRLFTSHGGRVQTRRSAASEHRANGRVDVLAQAGHSRRTFWQHEQ